MRIFVLGAVVLHLTRAFVSLPSSLNKLHHHHSPNSLPPNTKFFNNADTDNSSDDDPHPQTAAGDKNNEISSVLKRKLYKLAASFDRGFAATPKARTEANQIIQQLAAINPTKHASKGIDGDEMGDDVPLRAIWRMIWTSAFDVVSLGASPIAAPSAIYQVITDPPIATNIIDFIPRVQTSFPSSIVPSSLLRAEVKTRASSRTGAPERVGLVFEGVKLQPVELLGQRVDNLPPLSIDLTWQKTLIEQVANFIPGLENFRSDGINVDSPGYFDVEYLDDELLIIRQQAPGGRFALVKVDSFDP